MDTPGQTPDPTIQDGCVQAVTALFPDICLAYLGTVAAPLFYNSDAVINYIVDLSEKGDTYTRRPRAQILKRKREDDDEGDEDEEDEKLIDAKRKYCNAHREEEDHTTPEITLMYVPNSPLLSLTSAVEHLPARLYIQVPSAYQGSL